jgi:hypothetical protein
MVYARSDIKSIFRPAWRRERTPTEQEGDRHGVIKMLCRGINSNAC